MNAGLGKSIAVIEGFGPQNKKTVEEAKHMLKHLVANAGGFHDTSTAQDDAPCRSFKKFGHSRSSHAISTFPTHESSAPTSQTFWETENQSCLGSDHSKALNDFQRSSLRLVGAFQERGLSATKVSRSRCAKNHTFGACDFDFVRFGDLEDGNARRVVRRSVLEILRVFRLQNDIMLCPERTGPTCIHDTACQRKFF